MVKSFREGGQGLFLQTTVCFTHASRILITLCIIRKNGSYKQEFTVDEQKKEW